MIFHVRPLNQFQLGHITCYTSCLLQYMIFFFRFALKFTFLALNIEHLALMRYIYKLWTLEFLFLICITITANPYLLINLCHQFYLINRAYIPYSSLRQRVKKIFTVISIPQKQSRFAFHEHIKHAVIM